MNKQQKYPRGQLETDATDEPIELRGGPNFILQSTLSRSLRMCSMRPSRGQHFGFHRLDEGVAWCGGCCAGNKPSVARLGFLRDQALQYGIYLSDSHVY